MRYLNRALSGTNETRPRNAISSNKIADVIQVGRAILIEAITFGCSDPDTRTSDYISEGERILSYLK